MIKKKLGIIFPTYNRWKTIDALLGAMAAPCKKRDVDIIIFDSSSNEKTKNVTMNYILSNKKNVIYDRYTGAYDGFSIDTKVIDAIKKYASKYEYLWLCRDGLIINIKECYKELIQCMDKNPDYLVVDACFRCVTNQISVKEYRDNRDFCKEHFQRTSVLGTMIFRGDVAAHLVEEYPLNESNYSLWWLTVPFWDVSQRPFLAIFLCSNIFYYNPEETVNLFCNKDGDEMRQWVYYYTRVVHELPAIYNDIKGALYKLDLYDFHPFRILSLLHMRGNGGMNFKAIQQYKNLFPLVSEHSLKLYYLIALCPKTLARYIVNHQYTFLWRNITEFYRLAFLDIEE